MLGHLVLGSSCDQYIGTLGFLPVPCRSLERQDNASHGHVIERHRNQIFNFIRHHLFELRRIAEGKG